MDRTSTCTGQINTKRLDEITEIERGNEQNKWGLIWSMGEFSTEVRSLTEAKFDSSQEVHKREERCIES